MGTRVLTRNKNGNRRQLLWLMMAAAISFVLFSLYVQPGVDWRMTFAIADLRNPFANDSFTSPPWALLLLPHALLPLAWSNAINLLLNIVALGAVVRRVGGSWFGLALVFTSPVFFDLMRVNNIEWMVCAGLLLPPQYGLILVAVKPQIAGAAALVWARRHGPLVIAPLALVGAGSLAAWGWWPGEMGLLPHANNWNFAPWPVGLLPGAWLLRQAWRDDDEWLAAAITPLLVPYAGAYSLSVTVALLSGKKHRQAAIWLWLALWAFFVIELRR